MESILKHVSAQHLQNERSLITSMTAKHTVKWQAHLSTDTPLLHIFGITALSIHQGSIEEAAIILKLSRLP